MVVISTVMTTLFITDRMKAYSLWSTKAYFLYFYINKSQTNKTKAKQNKTEQYNNNNNNQNISVDCYGTDIIHTKHYILIIFDKTYVICRSKRALGNILGNI